MLHIQASCVLLSASFGWARSLNGSTSSSGDLAQSLESFWVRFDGYSTGHSILSIAYCFFVVFIQLLSQMGSLEGSMLSKISRNYGNFSVAREKLVRKNPTMTIFLVSTVIFSIDYGRP